MAILNRFIATCTLWGMLGPFLRDVLPVSAWQTALEKTPASVEKPQDLREPGPW